MEQAVGPGGVTYELERSSGSKTGYKNVVELRPGQFHAKPSVDGKQVQLPGDACNTAQEAALRLAIYKANPYPITKKNPGRAARGEGTVCRLAHAQPIHTRASCACCVCASQRKRKAYEVEDSEFTDSAMFPPWVVCANTFKLWRVGKKPPPEVMLSPAAAAEVARIQAWAEHEVEKEWGAPRAAPAPAQPAPPPTSPLPPLPPPQPLVEVEAVRPTPHRPFDPAILAKVAAIQSAARVSPVSVLGV